MFFKTRLRLSAFVVVSVIASISAISFYAIHFIAKKSISELTNKSTPLQISMSTKYRQSQEIFNQVKLLEWIRSKAELDKNLKDAAILLNDLKTTEEKIQKLNPSYTLNDELSAMHANISQITKKKLDAEEETKKSCEKASNSILTSISQIDDLSKKVLEVQKQKSQTFMKINSYSNEAMIYLEKIDNLRNQTSLLIKNLEGIIGVNSEKEFKKKKLWAQNISVFLVSETKSLGLNALVESAVEINKSVLRLVDQRTELYKKQNETEVKNVEKQLQAIVIKVMALSKTLNNIGTDSKDDQKTAYKEQEKAFSESQMLNLAANIKGDIVAYGKSLQIIEVEIPECRTIEEVDLKKKSIESMVGKIAASLNKLQLELSKLGMTKLQATCKTIAANLQPMKQDLLGPVGAIENMLKKVNIQTQVKTEIEKAKRKMEVDDQKFKEDTDASSVSSEASIKKVNKDMDFISMLQASVSIASILFIMLFNLAISRSLLNLLNVLSEYAMKIGGGDLTSLGNDKKISKDEVGNVMKIFIKMVEEMLKPAIVKILIICGKLNENASEQKKLAILMTEKSEDQMLQIVTTQTSVEEMSMTAEEIARNCHNAADNSKEASNTAQNGVTIVGNTVKIMENISEKANNSSIVIERLSELSNKIGEIIGTIEDIADRTNLLALNAAIEAARAGEQGLGFAVVADEVRTLASRTTDSTKEISSMIKEIQTETKAAVKAMNEAVNEVNKGTIEASKSGEALETILKKINAVTDQINQIAIAAEEQSATSNTISASISKVADSAKELHQEAVGVSEDALILQSLASEQSNAVNVFKTS